MKYRVKVWVVIEEESEIEAAAAVENELSLIGFEEVDVDWDSAEEVEDE
jgi:hypothetical protein